MATKLSQSLEDQVTCPICLEQYQDPRILPCLHTYCRRCLESMLEKGIRKFTIQCPECREIAQIEDVSSLKVNIWVNRFLPLLELSKAEKESDCEAVHALVCNNCGSKKEAKAKCFDCERFLCELCITVHQSIESLKNHKLITTEEIKESPTFCEKHNGEKLKLFCKTCEKLICRDCTIFDHKLKEHDFCFAEDTIDEQKEKVANETLTAHTIKRKVQSRLKSLQKVQETVHKNVHCTEKEIDKTIDKQLQAHIQAFEEKRKMIKGELRYEAGLQVEKLTAQQVDLLMHLTGLTSVIEFTEDLLLNGNTTDVLSLSKDVRSCLSQQSSSPLIADHEFKDMLLSQVPLLHVNEKLLSCGILYDIQDFAALSFPDLAKCEVMWSKEMGFDTIEVYIRDEKGRSLNITKNRITIHNVEDDYHNMSLERFLYGKPLQNGSNIWTLANPNIHRTQPLCSEINNHPSLADCTCDVNFKLDGQIIEGSPMLLCFWDGFYRVFQSLEPVDHKRRL